MTQFIRFDIDHTHFDIVHAHFGTVHTLFTSYDTVHTHIEIVHTHFGTVHTLMLFPYLDITYHGRVLGHLAWCRCELPPYL